MNAAATAAGVTSVPLHRQPLFVRVWTAQTVSVFGDQVSALAIPLTAGSLLGVLFLFSSPMPRLREEDIA